MVDQGDIFQPLTRQGEYAELCTVLYERELGQLALLQPTTVAQLQARLKSLPYYVRRAARGMLSSTTPLVLDPQNGSWQATQKRQFVPTAKQLESIPGWLTDHAALGLVLPVLVSFPHQQQVRLDSIDRIDRTNQRLHLNEFGWFSFTGEALPDDEQKVAVQLLKPERGAMTAACCGHQWHHHGRTDPRTLSLRELLLACTLSWPNFRSVARIPE